MYHFFTSIHIAVLLQICSYVVRLDAFGALYDCAWLNADRQLLYPSDWYRCRVWHSVWQRDGISEHDLRDIRTKGIIMRVRARLQSIFHSFDRPALMRAARIMARLLWSLTLLVGAPKGYRVLTLFVWLSSEWSYLLCSARYLLKASHFICITSYIYFYMYAPQTSQTTSYGTYPRL